jgi:hypothetical protein
VVANFIYVMVISFTPHACDSMQYCRPIIITNRYPTKSICESIRIEMILEGSRAEHLKCRPDQRAKFGYRNEVLAPTFTDRPIETLDWPPPGGFE